MRPRQRWRMAASSIRGTSLAPICPAGGSMSGRAMFDRWAPRRTKTPPIRQATAPDRAGSVVADGQVQWPPVGRFRCPLTLTDDATLRLTRYGVQISWPPAFSSPGRGCAVLVTATVQILLSLDSPEFGRRRRSRTEPRPVTIGRMEAFLTDVARSLRPASMADARGHRAGSPLIAAIHSQEPTERVAGDHARAVECVCRLDPNLRC